MTRKASMLVPLINHSKNNYKIKQNERIAQLLIIKTPNIIFNKSKKLTESDRKDHGFGSTGE